MSQISPDPTSSDLRSTFDSPPESPSQPPVDPRAKLANYAQIAIFALIAAIIAVRYPTVARNIVAFIITLGVLVFVHEWGHFQFARWFGMKVNRFALGFPPFIYTKRKNGIDYSIGALPIGGMVDIAGLGSEEEMVNTARGTSETPTRDTHRPFGQRQFQDGSLFARFMVLFAGPLMNFLFATIVFIGVFTTVGRPVAELRAQVASVNAGLPAAKAGLKAGDRIVAVDGKRAENPDLVAQTLQKNGLKTTTLSIERAGKTLQIPITPVLRDLNRNGKKVPSIGIAFDQSAVGRFSYEKLDPISAIKEGGIQSMGISIRILDTIKRALGANLEKEEVEGIGGPVKIAQTVGQFSEFGWPIALQTAGILSVNLGLLNLLPFPALDGGRILFLGYELVMRRPVNPRLEGVVHATGMVMLLAFMLFITWRDIAGIFRAS